MKLHSAYRAVFDQLPTPFYPENADTGIKRLCEAAQSLPDLDQGNKILDLYEMSDVRQLLKSIFGNSPFLTQAAVYDPEFLYSLLTKGPEGGYRLAISPLKCLKIEPMPAIIPSNAARTLRSVKRKAALATAIADISGVWPQKKVTQSISELAEHAIIYGVRHLMLRAHVKGNLNLPHPDDPEKASGYIVIGMGKLGARELNYSSDIDLIVFYDPELVSVAAPHEVQQNIVRLTRDLVQLLSERTQDGYVFRTDLRLRPDPSSTPLAISVDAAETYYESLGQNWERAAMIKARQVAGDREAGDRFLERLAPFVWRKNLDFGTIQDIHAIKRQINAQQGGNKINVEGYNVKLGRGGIREIEFFAQTQQLIWGGKHPKLREITTEGALRALAANELISDNAAAKLTDAYWYLRKVEHRLQMIADQQTHDLPKDNKNLRHVATFLGYENLGDFCDRLTQHLAIVEVLYAQLFEENTATVKGSTQGNLIFTGTDDDPDTLGTLAQFGFKETSAIANLVRNWHRGHYRAMRTERARHILTELMPRLLKTFGDSPDPDAALRRFDDFLSALPAGIQIFSLFRENPLLLELVAEVMGGAPRLARHLGKRPNLLDYVLEPEFFDGMPDQLALKTEISGLLTNAPDYESCLNQSRIWTGDRMLQIGIHALRQLKPWSQISASISDIASAVIDALATQVDLEFSRNHGSIPGGQWMILAMGKLGGREMTPSSDLDLIVVYNHDEGAQGSNGKKSLSPKKYYTRFTQRLINALTAPTSEGNLFEVDMRLRPSGNAGPIASHIHAFTKYHKSSAWIWEHMALVRARPISGDHNLIREVTDVIHHTLTSFRDPTNLLSEIAEMRRRIDAEHQTNSVMEIKYFRGGIIDIEFIIQYLQLRHAGNHPSLLSTNTSEALDRLSAQDLLNESDAETLKYALAIFQGIQGHLRLTLDGPLNGQDFSILPKPLQKSLASMSGCDGPEELTDCLKALAARVLEIYEKIVINN